MSIWGVIFVVLMILWGATCFPYGSGPESNYRGLIYGRSWLPYICFLMLSLFVFGVISPGFTGMNQPIGTQPVR